MGTALGTAQQRRAVKAGHPSCTNHFGRHRRTSLGGLAKQRVHNRVGCLTPWPSQQMSLSRLSPSSQRYIIDSSSCMSSRLGNCNGDKASPKSGFVRSMSQPLLLPILTMALDNITSLFFLVLQYFSGRIYQHVVHQLIPLSYVL